MADTGERPEEPPASPDDINSRLDEIAAELAAAAKFIEPSAAERARVPVGPRPARRSRRPFARRRQRPAARLGGPVPSASARAQAAAERRLTARSEPLADRGYSAPHPARTLLTLVVTLVVVLVLLAGVSLGLHDFLHRAAQRVPARTTHAASKPAPAPELTSQASFSPVAPFAGTPAANYASGAAGIAAPAARRYRRFTAAQVAADYQTVRQLLITSRLDLSTLLDGRTTSFARLLATAQRSWFLRHLADTGLSGGDLRSSRAWLISFAPGTTELIGTVIKVHGSMTARASSFAHRPALRIHADYLFVYAVEEPGHPDTGMRIVDRAYLTVYFGPWNEPSSRASVPWIQQILGSPAGAQCAVFDGYVRPAFAGVTPGVQPSGAPIDPWDLSTPPPTTGGCRPATRT